MFESISKYFTRGDSRAAELKKLDAEADQFKLPSETLPQFFKYVFFVGLAFLNFRLFSHTVPGAWGTATGIVAMIAECLAIYCSHYFSRAAGLFRYSLGICGALLMGFSLIHGSFSILDLIGVWEYSEDIEFYSRVVAFPLLAGLIGLTVLALTMTHPNNMVRLREALAHTRIASDRAEAASDARMMRTRALIERARLETQKQRTETELEYVTELEKYIGVEAKKRRLIAGISDPDMRQAVAQDFGVKIEPEANEKKRPGFTQNALNDPQRPIKPGGVLD